MINDLVLLICRVRTAVIWDHWSLVDGDGDTADAEFSAAGDAVTISQICEFFGELSLASPAARELVLLRLGPTLFVANANLLQDKFKREQTVDGGSLQHVELIAVDHDLRSPRIARTASKRSQH